ncbi:hypothetical protein AC249_AIPGENE7821 [Exaiptasia diaphana]|nr:hypothetical protein AC249_AIPGENE7821 [Exaiptasia diaphana]
MTNTFIVQLLLVIFLSNAVIEVVSISAGLSLNPHGAIPPTASLFKRNKRLRQPENKRMFEDFCERASIVCQKQLVK